MKLLFGAALLAAVALAASACGSSHPPSSATVSSSRLILDGAVRCTATLGNPVEIGHELDVSIKFENVSKRAVSVQPAYGGMWVAVKSSDGTTYDTRVPWENASGPPPAAIPLQPGATATRHLLSQLRVRWAGPLRVTPGCDISAAPAVPVAVTSPGRPVGAKAALDDVVAATGHLLDHCRPASPGVAVTGRIDAPQQSAPPLQTRCSITLHAEQGFDVAQVLVTTTAESPHVHLDELYEQFTPLGRSGNAMAAAWQFVVTKDGATSVASADFESSRGSGRVPEWQWTSTGPGDQAGSTICGSTGGGGGSDLGPFVEFVSACH